jgi:DNA polymerase III delta subunit
MPPPADQPPDRKPRTPEALRAYHPGPDLDRHLASGALHAVYLVTSAEVEERGRNEERPGADPQALLAAARTVEQAALKGGDASLDLVKIDYLDGDSQGGGIHALIVSEARSMSLFGGRRVITVVHADELAFAEGDGAKVKGRKKASQGDDPLEVLVSTLDSSSTRPPFVLILVAEHFDRRRRSYKALAQAGAVVEVAPMTVQALQTWLESEGRPWSIQIERNVAQTIWNRLGGSDAARLRQTADRLILDAGPKGQLTVRMVEDSVPMDREAAIWAITDAIADEDVTRALTVLHLMLGGLTTTERMGEVMRIMGFLNSQYTALLHVASGRARGKGEAVMVQELGMNAYRLKNLVRQLNAMKPGRLEVALSALDAADQVLKSSALGDAKVASVRWMEQLVIALARGLPLRLRRASSVLDAL